MSETKERNAPVWQAESQDRARSEQVKEALREIIDPEIGLNVIELGLIRDVVRHALQISAN